MAGPIYEGLHASGSGHGRRRKRIGRMWSSFWTEGLGYLASVLVAVSLVMSNIRRLRWINLAGALAFTAYAAVVGAWPVFTVNLFIVFVDAYYLERMRARKDFFTLLSITGADPLARKFLLFHRRDIARFFPSFAPEQFQDLQGFFVLRNILPVGAFFYKELPTGEVEIQLDYVIPEYRDHQNADFLYRILNERFGAEGRTALLVTTTVKAHQQYLLQQHFEADAGALDRFRKPII